MVTAGRSNTVQKIFGMSFLGKNLRMKTMNECLQRMNGTTHTCTRDGSPVLFCYLNTSTVIFTLGCDG